jgi:phage tail sheath protein FI
MKMRVRIGDLALPETTKKTTAKKDEDAAEPEASGNGSDYSFTLHVEKEALTGGWKPLETLPEVKVQMGVVEGEQQVVLAYKNNNLPKFVELILLETAALEKALPREQEKVLSIEKNLLEAPKASDFRGDISDRQGVEGLEVLDDITIVCVPDLMTTMPGEKLDLEMVKGVQTMMIAHCERLADRVAILDAPPDMTPQEIKKWRMETTGFDSSYAAMYYPWIKVMDPATDKVVQIPSSGHIAGVWARNDNTRGVHKAPANEVVLGAVGLSYQTTKGEQDTLNPNGVNCIRSFPGRGIRVWGARTLSSNPSWRYINVRRLFNYVEKSIENGTQWVVFEPNDRKLWARVKRDVTAFLRTVWRDGALFGSSPAEAFYVKVDDELNPPESRDLGRLIIEIGMSPVKPAEFVIFRISQWAGPGAE